MSNCEEIAFGEVSKKRKYDQYYNNLIFLFFYEALVLYFMNMLFIFQYYIVFRIKIDLTYFYDIMILTTISLALFFH